MTIRDLVLCPRDGLFCKDGRGWQTRENGKGRTLAWPHPSTVLGALRGAWGRGRESERGERWARADWAAQTADVELQRVLALCRPLGTETWRPEHRRWPAPLDALYVEPADGTSAGVHALRPQASRVATLGSDDDDARESLWWPHAPRGKPRPGPRWWSDADFVAWLEGRTPPARPPSADPPIRTDVHLEIDPQRCTGLDGRLFTRQVVETLVGGRRGERPRQWALAVRSALPSPRIESPLVLGGGHRLCAVEPAAAALFEAPEGLLACFDQARSSRLRLVVVTPADLPGGWLPGGFVREGHELHGRLGDAPVVLRAAFVGRPIAVAGWDMATNRPKPLSRMAPAGSVYFFERTDGRCFDGESARSLWLTALGRRREEGFGLVVPGVWKGDKEC
ncbi:MAG: CRISPR-associated protein Crm3 [Myxococcales bacterium]|nr:CRISPR-associated protein Crm3 [Myxococcales bacterium]